MIRKKGIVSRQITDVAVYDGRRWVGTLSWRLGRCRAINTSGRTLGAFDDATLARRALLDAALADGGSP